MKKKLDLRRQFSSFLTFPIPGLQVNTVSLTSQARGRTQGASHSSPPKGVNRLVCFFAPAVKKSFQYQAVWEFSLSPPSSHERGKQQKIQF
ncbi:MAG: hypothetical protein ABFR97_07930 [Thermodesulfobacteriota bacterium]